MKEKRKGENNKYFIVEAKCGHIGKQFYIPIKFAVVATNAKEAANIARNFPRVKHNHKDAILSVEEVDYTTFITQIKLNSKIDYLKCKSKYEQKELNYWIEQNRVEETDIAKKHRMKDNYYFEKESFIYRFGKTIRNLKKYSKFNLQDNYAF